MNIFFLNEDSRMCAQAHCDKHVVKMILEYAQMMSTAHRVLDPPSELIEPMYKPHTRIIQQPYGLENQMLITNGHMIYGFGCARNTGGDMIKYIRHGKNYIIS